MYATSDLLREANEIEPLIRARHQLRIDAALADARRGAIWGAETSIPAMPSDGEIRAEAEFAAAQRIAFRATPKGRFVAAVAQLESGGGYGAECEAARCCYRRSFAGDEISAEGVGRAIHILAVIPHQEARDAVLALSQLLMSPALAKAA